MLHLMLQACRVLQLSSIFNWKPFVLKITFRSGLIFKTKGRWANQKVAPILNQNSISHYSIVVEYRYTLIGWFYNLKYWIGFQSLLQLYFGFFEGFILDLGSI